MILTALFVAMLSRVGLLGFLEATSLPSNNMLYLLPAVPVSLFFVATGLSPGGAAMNKSFAHRTASEPAGVAPNPRPLILADSIVRT